MLRSLVGSEMCIRDRTLADSTGLPTVLAPQSLTTLIDMQLMQLTIVVNASSSSGLSTSTGAHNNSGSFSSPASVFGGLAHLKSITNNNTSSDSLLVPCFPAKPMPLVPKPVSIDIASIFISVPRGHSSGTKSATATKSSSATTAPKKAAGGEEKGGWLGGWGWKGSK
eukprot:TRINITY_DN5315_c0_g1_i7.p1 TRINITY_DN5315_c0_g1~~TRINITY_DN5315_c0_g1_i7.p1  ORF type:complete len:187 (-),score=83.08 TRINITY_DN5315_c0_g1_i7:103-606(-)